MIRVKLLSRIPASEWARYFDGGRTVLGDCEFVFDRDARDYDWLVVYDELPPAAGQTQKTASEALACAATNTLLITTEPESIKCYGRHYTGQFGHVLTSQPQWALPHPRRHWQQAANHWFYGSAPGAVMSREQLLAGGRVKTADASMVGSGKAQRHTQHYRRFAFMQRVQELMPELDVYGRGYRPMPDKAEALDGYRYHLCLENHIAPHHWTEKLSDPFIGRCLPFYCGAPNAGDYFPEGSFVPVRMDDPEGAVALMRQAIRENWYEQRLPLIEEARRRVLEEHHLFAVIARIAGAAPSAATAVPGGMLHSRHALRASSPWVALFQGLEKAYVRLRAVLERAA